MKEISQPSSGIDRQRNHGEREAAEDDRRLHGVKADEPVVALQVAERRRR